MSDSEDDETMSDSEDIETMSDSEDDETMSDSDDDETISMISTISTMSYSDDDADADACDDRHNNRAIRNLDDPSFFNKTVEKGDTRCYRLGGLSIKIALSGQRDEEAMNKLPSILTKLAAPNPMRDIYFSLKLRSGRIGNRERLLRAFGSMNSLIEFKYKSEFVDQDIVALLNSISQLPKLRKVEVTGLRKLEDVEEGFVIPKLAIPQIVSSLETMESLTDLTLGWLEDLADGLVVLRMFARNLRKLKLLSADVELRPVQKKAIVEAAVSLLEGNSRLEGVYLHCEIYRDDSRFQPLFSDGTSLAPFARVLGKNKTLKCLHVDSCCILQKNDLEPFLDLLENKNFTLTRLEGVEYDYYFLRRTMKYDEDALEMLQRILFYLDLNKNYKREHLLRGGASRSEWFDVIVENRRKTPVVFYYLSKNQSLLFDTSSFGCPSTAKRRRLS